MQPGTYGAVRWRRNPRLRFAEARRHHTELHPPLVRYLGVGFHRYAANTSREPRSPKGSSIRQCDVSKQLVQQPGTPERRRPSLRPGPRDPFEFGAVREIRSPAGERRRGGGHAARSTPRAAATPARKAGGGSAARPVKNPGVTPPSKARKQWEEFAKTWFSRNPTGSARSCRDAARAAGLLHVTKQMAVEQLHAAHARRKQPAAPATARRLAEKARRLTADRSKRSKSRRSRPNAVPETFPRATVVRAEDRCPSCDMVPDRMTGACRCG